MMDALYGHYIFFVRYLDPNRHAHAPGTFKRNDLVDESFIENMIGGQQQEIILADQIACDDHAGFELGSE